MKHVAEWRDRKCLVLFREVPGEPENALIVMSGELGITQHDELVREVESLEAQNNNDLANVLNGRNFSDGRIMLKALHEDKLITKVLVSEVVMLPTTKDRIPLGELNSAISDIQKGQEMDKPALADTSVQDAINLIERPKQLSGREAEEQLEIAQQLLRQADLIESDIANVQTQMMTDAHSKREEAYARAPELKPAPKPGRPKKSAVKKT